MYIPLLSVARGHPPPHCENTQVLREAISEDDDDEIHHLHVGRVSSVLLRTKFSFFSVLLFSPNFWMELKRMPLSIT